MKNPFGPHHLASSFASAKASKTTAGEAGRTRFISSMSPSDGEAIVRCYPAAPDRLASGDVKIAGLGLIVASSVAIGACGSGDGSSTRTGTTIPLSAAPSYKEAEHVCSASSNASLARRLGLSTTDAAAIATRYAERNAPPALRPEVYAGCRAGLTR